MHWPPPYASHCSHLHANSMENSKNKVQIFATALRQFCHLSVSLFAQLKNLPNEKKLLVDLVHLYKKPTTHNQKKRTSISFNFEPLKCFVLLLSNFLNKYMCLLSFFLVVIFIPSCLPWPPHRATKPVVSEKENKPTEPDVILRRTQSFESDEK